MVFVVAAINTLPSAVNFSCLTDCVIFDFEEGNLSGWTKTGSAFDSQPTYGDNPFNRGKRRPTELVGDWWIGTYENRPTAPAPVQIQGDTPQGTLTSPEFTIKGAQVSFRIGGGCDIKEIRVELVASGITVAKTTGKCQETMTKEVWDVKALLGKSVQLRIVDHSSKTWGHINFDHLVDETC